jgi:hypothetical protein
MKNARFAICVSTLMLFLGWAGDLPGAMGQNAPYYGSQTVRPVQAPGHPQQFDPNTGKPCGGYMMAPCRPAEVSIPAGATGEQVYQMASQAEASHEPKNVVTGYLMKSAEMGYVRAQAALGEDYLNGKGVPQDQKLSFYWLNLAAEQHSRAAQDLMGEFYEAGQVVPRDEAKAVEYYKLSAAQHYGPAERDLGLDYEFGRGVGHSRVQAIDYLKRAAQDGNDQISANYANALSRAPASTHFTSEDQIVAFMTPAAPKTPEGCRASRDFGLPDQAGLFCRQNPGCYFHVRALNSEYTKDPGWWYQCDTNISGAYRKIQ